VSRDIRPFGKMVLPLNIGAPPKMIMKSDLLVYWDWKGDKSL